MHDWFLLDATSNAPNKYRKFWTCIIFAVNTLIHYENDTSSKFIIFIWSIGRLHLKGIEKFASCCIVAEVWFGFNVKFDRFCLCIPIRMMQTFRSSCALSRSFPRRIIIENTGSTNKNNITICSTVVDAPWNRHSLWQIKNNASYSSVLLNSTFVQRPRWHRRATTCRVPDRWTNLEFGI